MTAKGERFDLNLELGDNNQNVPTSKPTNDLLVRDIQERETPSFARPPAPPAFNDQFSGFPAHKVRTKRSPHQRDRMKAASNTKTGPSQVAAPLKKQASTSQDELSSTTLKGALDPSIDRENKNRLAQMSEEEIKDARQELMSGLSPSLIERLLKKANIEEDESSMDAQVEPLRPSQDHLPRQPPFEASTKTVTFDEQTPAPPPQPADLPPSSLSNFDPDAPPTIPPPDLLPASSSFSSLSPPNPTKTHFPPIPGPPPTLDPSSPTFQASLKEHYFPSLPHDPSSLSWMKPPTPSEKSAYSPAANTLPPSSLRFDFRGRLLPPRLAAQIPTSKGLHHHGYAPESAGYTIPELAHLARSTVPSQRCIAFQTLGRVLYRLGRGDFGDEGEDLCEGLWECMEKGRVVQGLVEAAAKGEGEGNRSVWVTATEACWLWRKGGGRKWKGR